MSKIIPKLVGIGLFPPALILNKLFRIKFVRIRSSRIGHLAANTELFLRRKELGLLKKANYIGIAAKPVNKPLLNLFKQKIKVWEIPSAKAIRWLSKQLSKHSVLSSSGLYKTLPFQTNEYDEFNHGKRNISFSNKEEVRGKKLLDKIGVRDWFICFHSRDAAYLNKEWGKGDGYHQFRNCNVKNYLKAAEYIADQGGYALRMGAAVDQKISSEERVIDYANNFRTEFGDIYLTAKCKFFLGNTAGLYLVGTIFNVPLALANIVPIHYPPMRKGDLYIPKKIWSKKEKRFLTFKEMIAQGTVQKADFYHKRDMVPRENTAEEILDLATEMNQRLDGTWKEDKEDEILQKKYKSLFPKGCHCYGFRSRIGAKFLRENKHLLE